MGVVEGASRDAPAARAAKASRNSCDKKIVLLIHLLAKEPMHEESIYLLLQFVNDQDQPRWRFNKWLVKLLMTTLRSHKSRWCECRREIFEYENLVLTSSALRR